jgi:hypothetical protein
MSKRGIVPRRRGFDSGIVHMRLVVDRVAFKWAFSQYLGLPLSLSFYQTSILIIFVPVEQADEAWIPTENQCSFGYKEH